MSDLTKYNEKHVLQNGMNLREYFTYVVQENQKGESFPIDLNLVWPLVYSEKSKCVRALKEDFMENVHFIVLAQNGEKRKLGRNSVEYMLSPSCMEYLIARKIPQVFEVYRSVFHQAVNQAHTTNQNSETVNHTLPTNYLEALKALVQAEEEKLVLAERAEEAEATVNRLSDFGKSYTIAEISKEIGCRSSQELNKWLHFKGVQYKSNGTWIPYAKYADGYFLSKQNREHGYYFTKVAQKGRELILKMSEEASFRSELAKINYDAVQKRLHSSTNESTPKRKRGRPRKY